MGKVQKTFNNGWAGAVSRSIDDIIISIKNASAGDIPFGAPVFMTENGAVPFSTDTPQDFSTFLGFAVRVADKTPEEYPAPNAVNQEGTWKAGDVMEVLVRGSIAVRTISAGTRGAPVYIRKSDGKLTTSEGSSGSTVLLENVRIRNTRDTYSPCCEVVVNKRNIL